MICWKGSIPLEGGKLLRGFIPKAKFSGMYRMSGSHWSSITIIRVSGRSVSSVASLRSSSPWVGSPDARTISPWTSDDMVE